MRTAWIVAAGAIAIGFTVAVLATREPPPPQVSSQPLRESIPLSSDSGEQAARPRDAVHLAKESSVERDFEKEYMDAEDYFEFAGKLLVEARQGNGAAQYHLSMILSDCKAYDERYFRDPADGRHRRTYDEVVQHAVKRGGFKWEFVADKFKRCKRLLEADDSPFGNEDEWMNAATESGYPRALAQRAAGKAMMSRYEEDPDKADEMREEAGRLALEALRGKDPGAMFMIGNMVSTLNETKGAENPYEWIWILAACERGYDCSRQSLWYQFRCGGFDPACQPYENGVVDVVRRVTGSRFPDFQRRATELNEKLDQGRFDELGF